MRKIFTYDEQKKFSELSQDYNPIHLSSSWSRKEYPGKIVVYGIAILFWAIESSLHKSQIIKIKARFLQPVFLNEELILVKSIQNKKQILSIFIENTIVTRIELFYGNKEVPIIPKKYQYKNALKIPRDLTFEKITIDKGIVEINDNNHSNLNSIFPKSSKYIGKTGLQGFLSISRLVGMYCPGLRSIFSGFDIDIEPNKDLIRYKVIQTNLNLGFARIKINGLNLRGELQTYFTEDFKINNCQDNILSSKKYSNSSALIIGGSGLGNVAANILLKNGAKVTLTSRSSKNEYFEKSNFQNYSNFSYFQFDINDPKSIDSLIENLNPTIKSLYYFASPRIFRRRLNNISSDDLNDFLDIYVYKFVQFIEIILGSKKFNSDLVIGYPSSVAVSEKLPDQFEYYCAKQIGENACDLLKNKFKKINIEIERLPRLSTRQTNSFIKTKTYNNLKEIEKFIKNVERFIN